MKSFFLILFISANLSINLYCQCVEEYSKLYVLYFKTKIANEYLQRLKSNKVLVQDYAYKMLIPDYLELQNYYVKKYPIKFLSYDVYLIKDGSTHSVPYKIGIDSQYNVIKLSGFQEESHFHGDTSKFVDYNDIIEVNNFDLFKCNKDSIDKFIELFIKLTKFEPEPQYIKLTKNEFKIFDNNIVGLCTTEEIFYSCSFYEKYNYNWKYVIPNKGTIKFNNISKIKLDTK